MSTLLTPATAVLRLLRSASRFPSGSSRTRSSGPKRSEGGDMLMSSRGKAFAGLLVLAALTFSATLPGVASAGVHSPGERRLEAPAGLDRAAEPVADSSCGSVVVQGSVPYKLSVYRGSPSCGTVRRIARKYGHPTSKKPRFYCANKGYECEYSIYPDGWRCGGLFQGNFQCWHGANSPLRANEVFYGTQDLSARPLIRRPRDAFESGAWAPLADRRSLASPVGIFSAKGSKGQLAACDMYIPESRKRGVLCVSAIAGSPGHFREAKLLASGQVRVCSDTTRCWWVFDDPDPGPTFRPGHIVKDPPFRCRVLSRAVRCTLIGSGRGFLINAHEAREIGPKSGSASKHGRGLRKGQ